MSMINKMLQDESETLERINQTNEIRNFIDNNNIND